jgi:phosphatidylethanolamine/phosphatidyl-N-methylethanolamine N-methyltransferase
MPLIDPPTDYSACIDLPQRHIGPTVRAAPAHASSLLGDESLFLRALLDDPVAIGAIMPTRTPLAKAMAAAAVAAEGMIVELGGGTGPITRALLNSGLPPTRVMVVERNRIFHSLLQRRFPAIRVVCGDAEQLDVLLGPLDIGPVGAIVSSLPRIGWPRIRQSAILRSCFGLLAAGGLFLEFSYGPFSPVPRALVRQLGLRASRLKHVWGNFPPATIWGYSRPGDRQPG